MPEPMKQQSGWKDALKQSNAIGWLAFAVLIAGILVGALTFGRKDTQAPGNAEVQRTQSTQ